MSNKTKIFVMSSANYIISALFNTLTSVLAAYFAGDVGMSAGMMGIFFSMGGVLTAVAMSLPDILFLSNIATDPCGLIISEEAYEKNVGTYGRFANAAKYIDPRNE